MKVKIFLTALYIGNLMISQTFADHSGPPDVNAYTKIEFIDGKTTSGLLRVFTGMYPGTGKVYLQLSNRTILFDLAKDYIHINFSKTDREVASLYTLDRTFGDSYEIKKIISLTKIPKWKCGPHIHEKVELRKIKSIVIFIDSTNPSIQKTIQAYSDAADYSKCPTFDAGTSGTDIAAYGLFDPRGVNSEEVKNLLNLAESTANWNVNENGREERKTILQAGEFPVPHEFKDLSKRLLTSLKEGKTEISPTDKEKIEKFKIRVKFWVRCTDGHEPVIAGIKGKEIETIRGIYHQNLTGRDAEKFLEKNSY